MSVALLVVTHDNAETTQAVIVPDYSNNVVKVFTRTLDGFSSRVTWKQVTDLSVLPHHVLTADPVAIRLSANDQPQIALGKVTTIATKLLTAYGKARTPNMVDNFQDVVADLMARLTAGDSSLGDYVNDPRYTTAPVIPAMSQTPISHSEPVAPVVVDTLSGQVANEDKVIMQLATIPDESIAKSYVNRYFNGKLDFDVLDYALGNNVNVLMFGHAGSGKTMLAQAFASARRMPFYSVPSSVGTDPSQLIGKWIPNADGGFKWQDGAVTDIVRHGGVLLINEVTFMPERVATVLFGLLDYRRELQLMDKDGEVVKAHPNLIVIADHNPNYRGTRPLNQAFSDRFGIQLDFPYDPTIEAKLIKNKSILDMATKLRAKFDEEVITTPISTRTLVQFIKNAEGLGLDFAMMSYANSFQSHERSAIEAILATYRDNIAIDMGIAVTQPTPAPEVIVEIDETGAVMFPQSNFPPIAIQPIV